MNAIRPSSITPLTREPQAQPRHRVLNLGAGLQSSVLLLMLVRGELPDPPDVAVFADTGWEPRSVYDHLRWLTSEVRRVSQITGIQVRMVRLNDGDIRKDALRAQVGGGAGDVGRWGSMPFYIKSVLRDRDVTGGPLFADNAEIVPVFDSEDVGMIRRQCTGEYKIEPIRRWINTKLLGLGVRDRWPTTSFVEQTFGISHDERERMRVPEKWGTYRYPLVHERPMHRGDLREWAEQHHPGRRFPRSACVGCPYRSNAEWRHLRDREPEAWDDVVAFDRSICRIAGLRGEVFLHRSCVPLADAELGQRRARASAACRSSASATSAAACAAYDAVSPQPPDLPPGEPFEQPHHESAGR